MALHLETRCLRYVFGKGLETVFYAHEMIFNIYLHFFPNQSNVQQIKKTLSILLLRHTHARTHTVTVNHI